MIMTTDAGTAEMMTSTPWDTVEDVDPIEADAAAAMEQINSLRPGEIEEIFGVEVSKSPADGSLVAWFEDGPVDGEEFAASELAVAIAESL